MNIVKCLRCNKHIHDFGVCWICGNDKDFEPVQAETVHKNALSDFKMAELHVRNGEYLAAKPLLDKVVEWSPNCAEVHWLRLLIIRECTCDADLIKKGICVGKFPDFSSAFMLSNSIEKEVYSAVNVTAISFGKKLEEVVNAVAHQQKRSLNLFTIKSNMTAFVQSKRSEIIAIWNELERYEQQLKSIENEGRLVVHESKRVLEDSSRVLWEINREVGHTHELNDEDYSRYIALIDAITASADDTVKYYEIMKEKHGLVEAFKDASSNRKECINRIKVVREELEDYISGIKNVLDEYKSIQDNAAILTEHIRNGDYVPLYQSLGKEIFNSIFALFVKV